MLPFMLHKRRGALTRGALVVREVFLQAEDHLVDADPGLLRLTLALRGTLSVILATLAALAASKLLGWQILDFAAAITLSMMAPFLSREPTLRQRQRTLLVLGLTAGAATTAATLLHGQGPAGDSCFLLLVFLGFLLQPRGPRFLGIGLVSVVVTYVGLYLELPPDTLPRQVLGIAAVLPVIAPPVLSTSAVDAVPPVANATSTPSVLAPLPVNVLDRLSVSPAWPLRRSTRPELEKLSSPVKLMVLGTVVPGNAANIPLLTKLSVPAPKSWLFCAR